MGVTTDRKSASQVQIVLTSLPMGSRVLLYSAADPDMHVVGKALRWLTWKMLPSSSSFIFLINVFTSARG